MGKRRLSKLQREYREFFLCMLNEFEVRSPAELSYEGKREFFVRIREGWKVKKQELEKAVKPKPKPSRKKTYAKVKSARAPTIIQPKRRSQGKKEWIVPVEGEGATFGHIKTVRSEKNPNQTDDLTINYHPNQVFEQGQDYMYPVVTMPVEGALLKLPRLGRSESKGYKEQAFFEALDESLRDVELRCDLHLAIPYFNRPYEPDIVVVDRERNLYIDIEIDEPYDGYYRYPAHEEGKDDVRDRFFVESGWVVIRFTERQVHLHETECIRYVKDVLNSILYYQFEETSKCPLEPQWDYQQAVRWEKSQYREKYLGIDSFGKQERAKRIVVDVNEVERIEARLNRFQHRKSSLKQDNIAFEDETHTYHHPKDSTGNAHYISVTTLIDRFFPFDMNRFILGKSKREGVSEEVVLEEFLKSRDEAAEKGTYIHEQIERFLKGESHNGGSKEFSLFQKFYEEIVVRKSLVFIEAEKVVFLKEFNLAGTIDAVFKKPDSDEYVIVDWKRSKKLLVDGHPKKYGYGYALSELKHLDNSSYYKYALQQNLYKYMLEREYQMPVSSMNLIVLHDLFDDYYRVPIADMAKEVSILLESLNHKI